MHIARQSPTELVVVDSGRWVSGVCAGVAFVNIAFSIARHEPKGLFGVVLWLLFAILSDYRKTFRFDAIERVVSWKGRRLLSRSSGTICFSDIRDIAVEGHSGGDSGTTHRLTILTAQGSTPMAYAYSGVGNYERMRETILAFVDPGFESVPASSLAGETSLRSLLRQGRKIDAIALLRSQENMSLVEAVNRIDAIDAAMKIGK